MSARTVSWLGWWKRWSARRTPYYGSCPACGHDWREHPDGGIDIPLEEGCSECQYEVEHGERPPDEGICHRVAPPPLANPNS